MLIKTDDFALERIPAPLLLWYREHKRDLPWRNQGSPYTTWLSEIMLQQTRVEAVKGYFERFVKALPDVYALAACDEDKLLKLWEGLGYYSRARNLQKAAQQIVEEHGGVFPTEPDELKKLAGVGDYTAGAIASIAFGKRAPAVDGNVFRVLSRLMRNPTPIDEPKYREYLEERLKEVYPEEGQDCADFTQSLMELGATVCKPTSPACYACPLSGQCRAHLGGVQTEYPIKKEKPPKREEQLFVFLIETPQGFCVRKREKGVLKGTYEFPSAIATVGLTPEKVLNDWGMSAFTLCGEQKFTHIFTHIRWEMLAYWVKVSNAPFQTFTLAEIEEKVSLPTAFRQCLALIKNHD